MCDLKPKKLKKCCYIQPPVRESMKLKDTYERPTALFADETVYRGSYLPIDSKTAKDCRMDSMKPILDSLLDPSIKMDTNTVNKLSYQPVNTKKRIDPTWALKPTYHTPQIPMNLNTIYADSYRLPGKFVECDDGTTENLIVTYAEECNDIDGLIRIHGPHES